MSALAPLVLALALVLEAPSVMVVAYRVLLCVVALLVAMILPSVVAVTLAPDLEVHVETEEEGSYQVTISFKACACVLTFAVSPLVAVVVVLAVVLLVVEEESMSNLETCQFFIVLIHCLLYSEANKEFHGTRDEPEMSNILGVFGLSLRTREVDLEEVFREFGTIEKVTIVYDHRVSCHDCVCIHAAMLILFIEQQIERFWLCLFQGSSRSYSRSRCIERHRY